MKRIAPIILAIGFIGIVFGCGIGEDKTAAETIVINVLEDIKLRDIDEALTFYSPQFFQQTSKEEWKSLLQRLSEKLGKLESYKLLTWHVTKQVHTSGSGTYLTLQYEVQYSKYPATETLTVFKPIGGEYRILGHYINSVGLLKE